LGATAVLGTGAALAQDDAQAEPAANAAKTSGTGTASVTKSVEAQADAQRKAADSKAAAEKAAEERAAEKAAADRSKRENLAKSWVKPVDDYTKGSTFGIGGDRWANKHSGQDFVASTGTPVKAAHGGTVVTAGWGGSYGNNVVIKHDANTYTQYGHLSKIDVKVGQQLTTGQEIGKVGSTGNSTGPHLHFETRTTPNYGSGVEPVHFLKERGVTL
ncbi:M23 family metallopeptidase, partial [Streptomyces sp. NPDC048845]